jgi:hypothetical protein
VSDELLRKLENDARAAGSDAKRWLDLAVAALRSQAWRLAWTALDQGRKAPPSGLRDMLLAARAAAAQAWGIPFELEARDRARVSMERTLRFWQPRVTVGRWRGNDVVVEDDSVEGNQAFFAVHDGELEVENRFASHPPVTRVQGSPVVTRASLRPGDVVSFGKTRYEVRAPARLPRAPSVDGRALARGAELALAALSAAR